LSLLINGAVIWAILIFLFASFSVATDSEEAVTKTLIAINDVDFYFEQSNQQQQYVYQQNVILYCDELLCAVVSTQDLKGKLIARKDLVKELHF